MEEYQNVVAYEGRFGASPREVRSILYRAAQHPNFPTLTPMAIFDELERLVKDRTVYEFLQLEPRGKYHQPLEFIQAMKKDFATIFEHEASQAMTLVEDAQYDALLKRYIEGVVAKVKGEKIYNKATSSYELPSETMLADIEKILGISGPIERHREGVLGRIAAYKIDNPEKDIVVGEVFQDYLKTLSDHYYQESKKIIDRNFEVMLAIKSDTEGKFSQKEIELAELTYKNLEERFGYDELSAIASLKFLISFKAPKSV
jgi:serine protein kinase